MKIIVCLVAAACALAVAGAAAQARFAEYHRAPLVCVEDQPCWDCTTMGNKVCGAR